jgi:hypothetical protein
LVDQRIHFGSTAMNEPESDGDAGKRDGAEEKLWEGEADIPARQSGASGIALRSLGGGGSVHFPATIGHDVIPRA